MTNKTELETAKENYKLFIDLSKKKIFDSDILAQICRKHLQTCKRWLEFLKSLSFEDWDNISCKMIQRKISDLQETIKFYEDKGIQ